MVVVQLGASPYTEYYRRTFTLGTGSQQSTFSYTQPASTTNAMLAINVAQATGSAWIVQAALYGPGVSPAPTSTPLSPTATPLQPPTATPALTPTATSAPDTQLPVVSITNPADGSRVQRNKTVTIVAAATDDTGIDRVDFLVSADGYSWTCTDTTPVYSCAWKVPARAGIQYTLQATAYDLANNTSSHQVVVTSR